MKTFRCIIQRHSDGYRTTYIGTFEQTPAGFSIVVRGPVVRS